MYGFAYFHEIIHLTNNLLNMDVEICADYPTPYSLLRVRAATAATPNYRPYMD